MAEKADLRASIRMMPTRLSLRLLQPVKLAPLLVSEHYMLRLKLENMRYQTLKDVRVSTKTWVKIAGKNTPFKETLDFGDISARDTVERTWGPYLMREQGSSDVVVAWAKASGKSLTILYENRPSRTWLHTYDAEPWSSIVQRLVGVITFITLMLTILKLLW